MDAKLFPSKDLRDFFYCPKPARQSNEGVREVEHDFLSFVHGADNPKFRKTLVRYFVGEELWDYAASYTSGFQHSVGDFSHEPDISAAVNEFIAPIRQCLAKLLSHCHVAWVKART